MAETPENNKQNEGAKPQPAPTTPAPTVKASLSEKAEKLAARLEEHKNQQPKPTQAEAATPPAASGQQAQRPSPKAPTGDKSAAADKGAQKPAAPGSGAAQPAAGKPKAEQAPAAQPAPKTTVQPVTKKPAAPATKPVSKLEPATEPVEDVIRAIKLPHEIAAEKKAKAAQNTGSSAAMPASVPPVTVAGPNASQKSNASAAAVAEARSRVFGSYVPEPEPSEAAVKRRVARERALNSKPPLGRTAQVLLALIFPVLSLIAAIRLVATPAFLALAYGRPGFPADAYGFSWPERLTYGSYGVDYLNNFAGPEYLSGLRQADGSALFTDAEVQHMVDVKNLIGFAYVLGAVLAVLAIVLIVYLMRRYAGGVRRGLFAGALITLGLMAALVVAAVIGWQGFFTKFHELFFSEGSWTFYVTDTLIRLYPQQFWIDSAISLAVLLLLVVIIVLITCWPTGRRREASRLRQDARVFGLGNS
ncbi:TIGR01906 family membrane protein [Glutamicibacter creatinolyticus]|uniref:TIGR01906 family membrane protein n=1 Tax=Glutamicibacter creatinolyticus TaxID=162496 RepID=UPI0033E56B04